MYEPGIYLIRFSGDYSDITGTGFESDTFISLPDSVIEIGSITIDAETRLARVESYEDLATEPSFYNNIETRECYFRLPDYNPADYYTIQIGIPEYISDQKGFDELGIPYEPALKSNISVTDARDGLVESGFVYNQFSVTMENVIDLTGKNLVNQQCRIYEYEEGQAKQIVYTGYIESYSSGLQGLTLKLNDDRKRFEAPILKRTISKTAFPNLSDSLDGSFVHLRIGNILNVKAVCLNGEQYEKADAGTYTFIVTDPTYGAVQAITNARVSGIPRTINTTNLTQCTFTIDKAADETIDVNSVFVDVNSYSGINNGADIIKFLIEEFQKIQFTSTRFDLTEWNATKAEMYNSVLNIEDQTEVKDAISQIANSNIVLFAVKPDGKITLREEDLEATPVAIIEKEAIKNFVSLKKAGDNSNVYSEVIVTYNGGKTIVGTESTGKAIKLYNSRKSLKLDYNIESDSNAVEVTSRKISLVSDRREIVSITINNMYGDIVANDIIEAEISDGVFEKLLVMKRVKKIKTNELIIQGAIING